VLLIGLVLGAIKSLFSRDPGGGASCVPRKALSVVLDASRLGGSETKKTRKGAFTSVRKRGCSYPSDDLGRRSIVNW